MIKKRTLFYLTTILISACLAIYSCTKNEVANEAPDLSLTDNYKNAVLKVSRIEDNKLSMGFRFNNIVIDFVAVQDDKAVTSTLILRNVLNDTKTESGFFINTGKRGYKFGAHEKVIKAANQLVGKFSIEEVEELLKAYEEFGTAIFANKSVDRSSNVVKALYYHKAIFSTLLRSLKEKEECGCTPHPAYFVDKMGFSCQEDFYIDPDVYLEQIKKMDIKTDPTLVPLRAFLLANKNKGLISYDRVRAAYIEPKANYMKRITFYNSVYGDVDSKKSNSSLSLDNMQKSQMQAEPECMEGSDFGCCGNYEGCCIISYPECFWHDLQCFNSQCWPWWYCGPSCTFP